MHKLTRALCGRVNDNEKRAVLFSRWCNFIYFTHYCLTQCILFMFICRLLFNRRIRHLHLLRCAWALLIKRLLCVIGKKKLNACKYSHCNRNIGNTVPWKSLFEFWNDKIRKYHSLFSRRFFHTYESVTNYSTRSCGATQLLKNVLHPWQLVID